ncbi:MAG: universal stress protein [Pseudomonadota bacterium]
MRTRSHAEPTVVVTVKDPHVVDRDYLAKAVALARGLDCRLALVHVAWSAHARNVALAGRGTARDVRSWLQEDALLGLHRWAARAVEAGAGATPVVLWGWPESDQLVRYVVRTRPRFVLVRSPARRPLGRFFKAYHDWELLRGVPAPLLLVREAGPWRRPRVVAAVDPLHDHEKTADLDERIVGTAAEVAAALGGALHLVHAAARTGLTGVPGRPATSGAAGRAEPV